MKWLILFLLIGCSTVKPDIKPDSVWREQKMDMIVELEDDIKSLNAALQIVWMSLSESDRVRLKRTLDWYTARYYSALVGLADDDKKRTEENIEAARRQLNSAARLIRGYAM